MSRKLPIVSGEELVKFFCKKFGFVGETGRKHYKLKGVIKNKLRIFPVPIHKELAKGTLLEIIKQAGLTRKEFLKLWNK